MSALRMADNTDCIMTHYIADKVDRLIKIVTVGIKAYKKLIFRKHLGYVVEIIRGTASS